mgnify:CR=1 FL=1
MAYQALYRTFRPKTLDDVVRQEHIVTILKHQIETGKIGHAYLFCGPRGTGKTSIAKIFASAINCESPVNGSACGKCPTCKALAEKGNLDITEIDGFDDLHHADGILKEEQERAARVFGAEESHFLVNGSTAGILSAVMGCTHRGDKILVARHCHKSIYHAIYMNGLVPRYVYPKFDISMHMNGEISKEDVAKALAAEPDIKAVVIVSPNYDGVVSDVKGIAEVAHSYRIPLIVDEAHGPHFGFHPAFPGRRCGDQ